VDTGPAALVRGGRLRLGQLLSSLLSSAITFTRRAARPAAPDPTLQRLPVLL